ncbi:MAG: hypothetical protein HY703_11370, partial [Gemmatimonadetes bacterium]|nr:hypothetical protein [Gemmatimonadota bacterium]
MSATGRRVSGGRRLAPPQARRVALLFLVLCPLGTGACRGQNREDLELRAAVDSLLPRLESLAGLRARRPVGVARRGRAELRRYVLAQLGKELPPAEAEGIEATYRALGLFPDTLDLRRLLLELYTEQVMGYYDPETDTLYVMEGVPRDVLEPVLAHELVHALQD